MTWAQAVFAFCGGVLAPTTGFLCARRLRRQDGSPLMGFILGFGGVFCALITVSALAILIFPRYPREPVSEPLAVSLTLPVLGASILAVWLVTYRSSHFQPFPIRGASILLALYLGGVCAAYHLFTWPYLKALPWSATEVKEFARRDGFLPDYAYYMRARITEDQFRSYVAHFELQSVGTREHFRGPAMEASWWNPSPAVHEVFRREEGDWEMEAVFDHGIIWVMAIER